MIKQRKPLELVAKRTRGGKETSYRSLVREWNLSIEAACGHLRRLWEERLIEATSYRVPRSKFRLESGESIRDLRFRLTKRGDARLRWYEERDEEDWSL